MSQNDFSLANQSGASFRTDLNSALQALASNSSEATAPSTTYAYMWWADTTTGLLKQRNAANSGWIVRGTLAETLSVARSSDTVLGVSDRGKLFKFSSTFTQTVTACATLGDGWYVFFRNTSSGEITIDPNSTETVDGASTIIIYPGESGMLWTDGSNLFTVGRRGFKLDTDTSLAANSDLAVATQKAIKAYVDASAGAKVPVRQTVLSAAVSAGVAAFIAAGSGLAVDLDGSPTPVTIAFAAGFGSSGASDFVGQISSDQASYWSSLAANTLTFLAVERNAGTGALTSYKTIIPPQYGYTYDRTQNALLHFDGADGATTFTDDYGNTWAVAGNAQLDTAQQKFGSASLLLDGTGDYVETTDISQFPDDSWTMECFVRFSALPSSGARMNIMNATNGSTVGVLVALRNDAGPYSLRISLSSNGSTNDIANDVQGVVTPVVNTWYHVALTYDAVAGKYISYFDGVQATSTTSAARINVFTKLRLGESAAGNYLNGWVDEFRLSPCCRYPNGTTFTPSASAFAVEGHFFSRAEMKMYEVTSASASAGTDPGTTAVQRVFVGEATAGAASVSSVRSYALQGKYVSPRYTPANSTLTTNAHNLGVMPTKVSVHMRCVSPDAGYVPGDELVANPSALDISSVMRGITTYVSPKNVKTIQGASSFFVCNATTGAEATLTNASWRLFVHVDRGW